MEALAVLRRESPVTWHSHPESGPGFWSIVRHSDVAEMSKNFSVFVNRYGTRAHHEPGQSATRPGAGTMLELDPPEHTRNRKYVAAPFAPRSVRMMREQVRQRAQRIIAELPPSGEVEFVAAVSTRLPVEVTAALLGVDDMAMTRRMVELTNLSLGDQDPDYGGSPEAGSAAVAEMRDFGLGLARERRHRPRHDLMSQLATIEMNGARLSDEELSSMFSLLMAGGIETTRSTISFGLLAFSQFAEQRTAYLSAHGELSETAAEEILRWSTPTRVMARTVESDITFRGMRLRRGDKVALWYVSANNDEEVFSGPGRFDITRRPNQHMTFGAGGPHICLGAHLARLEVAAIFDALFERFPGVSVVGAPKYLRGIQMNSITEMHVELG
jgi:hypothetical protein